MRDRIYNAINEAERYADAAFDVLRNSIERALDDAARAEAKSATAQPPIDALRPAPTPDAQWPKRAEIVAVLSAHYGAPAESVEEWLTDYFSW